MPRDLDVHVGLDNLLALVNFAMTAPSPRAGVADFRRCVGRAGHVL